VLEHQITSGNRVTIVTKVTEVLEHQSTSGNNVTIVTKVTEVLEHQSTSGNKVIHSGKCYIYVNKKRISIIFPATKKIPET